MLLLFFQFPSVSFLPRCCLGCWTLTLSHILTEELRYFWSALGECEAEESKRHKGREGVGGLFKEQRALWTHTHTHGEAEVAALIPQQRLLTSSALRSQKHRERCVERAGGTVGGGADPTPDRCDSSPALFTDLRLFVNGYSRV